ncbi:hypothetical protein ACA910_017850 [Epithemia clementina (nom. ined.)]
MSSNGGDDKPPGADMFTMQEFEIGGQKLKNRLVLSPMTRARCTPSEDPFDISCTIPNEIMGDYYEQRANAGLLVTEGTFFCEEGSGWRNAPWIQKPEHVEGWKKITDRVHKAGSVIYCQLWHLGRTAHSSHHPSTNRIVAPSSIAMKGKTKTVTMENVEPEVPHALTEDEIQELLKDYANAALRAKEAGFDGLELHGANGYLIDQFLQSSTNHRTDEYGGSVENRTRLLREIYQTIVDSGAYPANRIGFRLSPNGNFSDMGSEDNKEAFPEIARIMNAYKPAYLHVMDGTGFGYHNKSPVVTVADFRKVFDGPILCNIGLTKDMAEGMLRSGAADMAVFGRLYISNPDLALRFLHDWPLTESAPYETWWTPTGAAGYTDWPTYQEQLKVEA